MHNHTQGRGNISFKLAVDKLEEILEK
jgi:hypothetical protein